MTFAEDIASRHGVRFRVTGSAAHSRLAPLVPSDWNDCSPSRSSVVTTSKEEEDNASDDPPDFLWENAPRHETRSYRNHVKCYSHLPNGTDILDSKWVLARLFCTEHNMNQQSHHHEEDEESDEHGPSRRKDTTRRCGVLETHCFRGITGLRNLVERLDLNQNRGTCKSDCSDLYDLTKPSTPTPRSTTARSSSPNLWMIKDAGSNGAGGIWVLGPSNVTHLTNPHTSPLIEDHRYVAQRYVWPPVLYQGRKCHVRVYGLFTSHGRAFVHQQCFLHVANDPFTIEDDAVGTDSIHITNCCANSHDQQLFAGEICASLLPLTLENDPLPPQSSQLKKHTAPVVPLDEYANSIYETVAEMARRSFPFLQGGHANHGFEYLGLDFILSHDVETGQPMSYLLEVNAPPSQDTATGLCHAETLHNAVISDLLTLWVFPNVLGVPEQCGGWHCVYHDRSFASKVSTSSRVLPSKAAILNKMRWATYERKLSRMLDAYQDEERVVDDRPTIAWSNSIREYFPYFDSVDRLTTTEHTPIFFENAGGSQVPTPVIHAVERALSKRHRSVVGYQARQGAEATLRTILGASLDAYVVHFGSNATTLFTLLAHCYRQSGLVSPGDEILISIENHMANVTPWIELAQTEGATVVWCRTSSAASVQTHLTSRTRIVALSHASNLVGHVRDIASTSEAVRRITNGTAHIIVDGVAVAPHRCVALDDLPVDWYAVSCHKMFGTHLGVLCGRQTIVAKLQVRERGYDLRSHLEMGTVNFEACAGIEGLGKYFSSLASIPNSISSKVSAGAMDPGPLTRVAVAAAYKIIERLEEPLVVLLRQTLSQSSKVNIVEDLWYESVARLPVFSFVHCDILSCEIVDACSKHGVACRSGTFLSTSRLQKQFDLCPRDGVVRISLAHYNTAQEIFQLGRVLETIPGWF